MGVELCQVSTFSLEIGKLAIDIMQLVIIAIELLVSLLPSDSINGSLLEGFE